DYLLHVSLSSGVAKYHTFLYVICPLIDSFILECCNRLEKIGLLNLRKIKSVSMRMCKNQRVKIDAPTLENLFFLGINLDENILQTLLNSCPLIVNFILERCSGLKKIELLNHQNIKLVSIKTKGKPKHLVKSQIPTLEHFSYYGLRKEELDVTEFQNLKSLDISYVKCFHVLSDRLMCMKLKIAKVYKYDGKNQEISMADILPECLIQKILCCLNFKEATKITIISKTWLQAWLTLPDLKFTTYYLNRNTNIVDNIMERYRDGKIPIQKFELSYFVHYTSDFFHLIDKWLDIAFQNGVENLIFRVHVSRSYCWSIFKIMAAKLLRELVLSNCDLMYDSLSSGVAGNCSSLRKLSLSYIILNDNILQILLNSCPLIVTFTLQYCSGLEKIELPSQYQ
ncbi:hypothetical protein H5410_049019, partial [Solanum commersonii]